jgi:DNA-binding transcriptional LysR family regulator
VELRQLEYFVAVAEEGGFTRGARRVHIVQSAVSASLAKLERELGVSLFDRRGRRIALTDAGQALLPEARAALTAAQAGRDAIELVRGGLRGTVTIGTMLSTGTIDLPAALGRFHAGHPQVTVRLRQATAGSAGHVQALLDGTLDLALLSLTGPPPAGISAEPLAREPLRLVCPPGHPFADRPGVTLEEVAGETFIDFPPGWGNRAVVDRAFAAIGHERAVPFETADFATAVALVRQGLGVSFLPDSVAKTIIGLPLVTVADQPLTWSVSVATGEGRRLSAAARALLTHLEQPAGPGRYRLGD